MTVEQSPLERFPNQKPQQQPPLINSEKDGAALSPGSGVIDLTNDPSDKEEDLKKAIALSLKEHERTLGGHVTMEDQDISRVIEASLAESKAVGTKRKRGEVWQDPLNPHDRHRQSDWPVGLKNVGNTCWFSAVIQSLFHLPIFRRLLLNYSPKDWNSMVTNPKEKRNLSFMHELRKLFALLQCSKRKYVDPSHALEEFKEAFPDSSGADSQQDVSEFSHKLLEWLEEAFKIDSYQQHNSDSMMDGSEQNPMLDLFYGHFLSEGHNEGRMFCNEETFGQYPLQVNGFNNIHESLEAAMTQEIESYDVMTKSGQESWFTRLPPVMLFELSRFQFNQQLGRPEKIHNILEFPQIMYMDRYMEQNKATTRAIREKTRRLKAEREKLQNQLEKYLNYGSKKVPLQDVLQYTLDFAESRRNNGEVSSSEDIEMSSPGSISSQMTNHLDEIVPCPQHVSDVELKVLQSCLKRWRKEIEGNVKNLQDSINTIDNTVKEIYDNPSLQRKPYRLHAVLVHEGQAASGHYWAYVFSPKRNMWLKFNDVSVTEATWLELQKDSVGGHLYASAYCLVYIDELKSELFEEDSEVQIGPENISSLPSDLHKFVQDDNMSFLLEMEQWDIEQSRKKDSSTMTMADGECQIIAEKKSNDLLPCDEGSVIDFYSRESMEHAIYVHKKTVSLMEGHKSSPGLPSDIFAQMLRVETSRIKRVARNPVSYDDDCRLQHIGVYIILNSSAALADPYVTLSIMEQFLIPEMDDIPNGSAVREIALRNFKLMQRSLKVEQRHAYQNWHVDYSKFRKVVSLFVYGIQSVHSNNIDLPTAVTAFLNCCELNNELLKSFGTKPGLNPKLVNHYRRQTALKFNEFCVTQFESLEDSAALNYLIQAYDAILPSIEFLSCPNATESDTEVLEKIRSRWCSVLGVVISSSKQERLQDFLSKLLDPSSGNIAKARQLPSVTYRVANLEERMIQALKISEQSGEMAAALSAP